MNAKSRVLFVSMMLVLFAMASSAYAQKKELVTGPYFQTLKPNDRIDVSIERGRKLFNELGCAGCHPRGGTIGGTAVDATGNRMNIEIPSLHDIALHYPRRAASGFMATIGTMNDLWNTIFLGREPMDPNSQEYIDLYAYVSSLTPSAYKAMKEWEEKRLEVEKKMAAGNPCAASNPCAAKNPCAANPCAPKNPCSANPCAPKNPCVGNPCAVK